MEVHMVADIVADMVADKVADMVANMVADKKKLFVIPLSRRVRGRKVGEWKLYYGTPTDPSPQ